MTLPDYQAFMRPVLEVLADGRERPILQVVADVADLLEMSQQDRSELMENGRDGAEVPCWLGGAVPLAGQGDHPRPAGRLRRE